MEQPRAEGGGLPWMRRYHSTMEARMEQKQQEYEADYHTFSAAFILFPGHMREETLLHHIPLSWYFSLTSELKPMEPDYHGLTRLKPWAKINLSLLNCYYWIFCHDDEKPVSQFTTLHFSKMSSITDTTYCYMEGISSNILGHRRQTRIYNNLLFSFPWC